MSKKINFSEEEIIKINNDYINNNQSPRKIAKEFDYDVSVIHRIIKELNLPKRKRGYYNHNPPPNKLNLNNEIIKDMYLNKNLSSGKIAKELNCSNSAILNRFKKLNIDIKGAGFFNKGKIAYNRKKIDVKEVKRVYESEKPTISDLSKRFNCSKRCMENIFKREGIKVIGVGFFSKRKLEERLNKNKDIIINFYKSGKTLREIQNILRISSKNISILLKENNIRLRYGGYGKESHRKIKFFDSEISEIKKLYEKELMSSKDIAKIFNCSFTTVIKTLRENNINTSKSYRRKLLFKEDKLKSWNKGLTKEDPRVLKNITNGSRKTQFKKGHTSLIKGKTWEELYGEEKADEIRNKITFTKGRLYKEGNIIPWNKGKDFLKLEKNPRWLGGKSFEPYGVEFNNKFKRAIRKRDNHECLKCGVHQEKLSRALTVHHINYDKLLTIPENCCALCNNCNSEVNSNRKHWTKFFQSLLSERYGYKYNENNEVILEVNKLNTFLS